MRYWNVHSVITVVSLLSSLLMPPFISAAEKLSALYSAQSVSYSLPWIAQDAGLFRKHNLDFQLVYIPSSGVATAALSGGDVEIALAGGVGIVRAFAQGATELVFIGGFKNALTHSIVAKPDISRPEDLRGKKIGITRLGSNSHYFAVQALRRMGLTRHAMLRLSKPAVNRKSLRLLSTARSMRLQSRRPPTTGQSLKVFVICCLGRICKLPTLPPTLSPVARRSRSGPRLALHSCR